MPLPVSFTLVSQNAKTGRIPVSGSNEKTCGAACPFRSGGCYAKSGYVRIHWDRLNSGRTGIAWKDFLANIKALPDNQIWRHNVHGDLAGYGNRIDRKALADLTEANRGKRGFGYSHKIVLDEQGKSAPANREAIKAANLGGFTVNLSGNSVEHADKLKALGIAPVVSVVPQASPDSFTTPAGNRVIVCPAQTRQYMTCAICGLCSKANRSVIIGFRPHGNGARAVEAVASAAAAVAA